MSQPELPRDSFLIKIECYKVEEGTVLEKLEPDKAFIVEAKLAQEFQEKLAEFIRENLKYTFELEMHEAKDDDGLH